MALEQRQYSVNQPHHRFIPNPPGFPHPTNRAQFTTPTLITIRPMLMASVVTQAPSPQGLQIKGTLINPGVKSQPPVLIQKIGARKGDMITMVLVEILHH